MRVTRQSVRALSPVSGPPRNKAGSRALKCFGNMRTNNASSASFPLFASSRSECAYIYTLFICLSPPLLTPPVLFLSALLFLFCIFFSLSPA